MPDDTLEGKVRHETVQLDRDTVFGTFRIPYPLGEADYLRLTKIQSFIPIWAHGLFAGTAVFFVALIAKVIDNKYFEGIEPVENVEWITLGILVILAIGFEILNYKVPTERRKVMRKVANHFEVHQPESAIRSNRDG